MANANPPSETKPGKNMLCVFKFKTPHIIDTSVCCLRKYCYEQNKNHKSFGLNFAQLSFQTWNGRKLSKNIAIIDEDKIPE